ncbi:MAG TPA: glycosyltransferase, partial [Longimicrobium sp.]|nr:glycosyltransferase [Longimicrobium sp.]
MRLSIVVPTWNEATEIAATLRALQPLRARGHEVVLADGGSTDATVALSAPWVDRVIVGARGRATQQNAGAAAASGDVLLFLHADTRLPEDADGEVIGGLERSGRG